MLKAWFRWLMLNNKRSFAEEKLGSPVTCKEKNEIFTIIQLMTALDGDINIFRH